jgi:hypothetical protein
LVENACGTDYGGRPIMSSGTLEERAGARRSNTMLIRRALGRVADGVGLALSRTWTRVFFALLVMLSVAALAVSFVFSSDLNIAWLSRGSAFFLIWLAVVLFSFYIDKARHTA